MFSHGSPDAATFLRPAVNCLTPTDTHTYTGLLDYANAAVCSHTQTEASCCTALNRPEVSRWVSCLASRQTSHHPSLKRVGLSTVDLYIVLPGYRNRTSIASEKCEFIEDIWTPNKDAKLLVPIAPFGSLLYARSVLHYSSTAKDFTWFSDIDFSSGSFSGELCSTRQPRQTFSVQVEVGRQLGMVKKLDLTWPVSLSCGT